MPISKSIQLFKLVKSMTKAEKRNFTIYAKRIQNKDSLKFMTLFEIIDKQNIFSEKTWTQGIQSAHFSNVKRHLYSQILSSLRLLHSQKDPQLKVKECIDFAQLLYQKGLYLESLKLLKKGYSWAEKLGLTKELLDIVALNKMIEARRITRTGFKENEKLIVLSSHLAAALQNETSLSNLNLAIHGWYITKGYAFTETDRQAISRAYAASLFDYDQQKLKKEPYQLLLQCKYWYAFIRQDYGAALHYAVEWVTHLTSKKEIGSHDPDLIMRSYHFILKAAYFTNDRKNYIYYFNLLEQFRKDQYDKFTMNSKVLSFIYVHHNRLNTPLLTNDFSNVEELISRTSLRIKRYAPMLDNHRLTVFNYKIACLYFIENDVQKCLEKLHKIIALQKNTLNKQILGYSRLLMMMCHYSLGNLEMIQYLLTPTKKSIQNLEYSNPFLVFCLDYFIQLLKQPLIEHKSLTATFYQKGIMHKQNQLLAGQFMNLDFNAWLYSILKQMSVKEAIAFHFNKR